MKIKSFVKLGAVLIAVLSMSACNDSGNSPAPSPNTTTNPNGPTGGRVENPTPTPFPTATPIPVPPRETSVRDGVWGGNGIRLTVRRQGATVEFDCAYGVITPLYLDTQNQFRAQGTVTVQHPGPVAAGEVFPSYRATYSGRDRNGLLTLALQYSVSNRQNVLQEYELRYGSAGSLHRCR